jgi:hypothetical protein
MVGHRRRALHQQAQQRGRVGDAAGEWVVGRVEQRDEAGRRGQRLLQRSLRRGQRDGEAGAARGDGRRDRLRGVARGGGVGRPGGAGGAGMRAVAPGEAAEGRGLEHGVGMQAGGLRPDFGHRAGLRAHVEAVQHEGQLRERAVQVLAAQHALQQRERAQRRRVHVNMRVGPVDGGGIEQREQLRRHVAVEVEAGGERGAADGAPHAPHHGEVGFRILLRHAGAMEGEVDPVPGRAGDQRRLDLLHPGGEGFGRHRPAGLGGGGAQHRCLPARPRGEEGAEAAELRRGAGVSLQGFLPRDPFAGAELGEAGRDGGEGIALEPEAGDGDARHGGMLSAHYAGWIPARKDMRCNAAT